MGGVSLSIDGIDEIKEALAALSKGIGDRAFQELNKNAAKIGKKKVLAAAKARRLRKANTISIKSARGKDRTAVLVGYNKRGYVARFFEKGGRNRKTRKGYNRGTLRKRPFVRSAFESAMPKIINYINSNAKLVMIRNLEKYSKRLAKKQAGAK